MKLHTQCLSLCGVKSPEREEKVTAVDGPWRFPLLIGSCVSLCITIMRIIGSALTGPLAARMPG